MKHWMTPVSVAGLTSLLATAMVIAGSLSTTGYPVVPGTGEHLKDVGDDFEDPKWEYTLNLPKSSTNLDGQDRLPAGTSANGRIYESTYRGTPEVVQRIPTPAGGKPGSTGALLMRSLQTGVPGFPSMDVQQDDLMVNVNAKLGGFIPVRWSPSIVARVFLPPFNQWERRTGPSFALRADVRGTETNPKPQSRWNRGYSQNIEEPFWPGIFIQFNSRADTPNLQEDSAMFLIRAGSRGEDIVGPVIKETGWWTLGMSFTSDGKIHYYASQGADDLTPKDHLGSYFPYSSRCMKFETFFFNVVNANNGRTWSTPWIIDDPAVYVIRN